MEIQLQELLDKIKREGIDSAKVEAARLVSEAESRAALIVSEAEREAKARIEKAKIEAAKAEEAGRAALAQASRDLLLAFRDKIGGLLDVLVKAEAGNAFTPRLLEEALPVVLKALASGGSEDLTVLLPPNQLAALDASFMKRLGAELGKGIELKPYPELKAGFRVVEKSGAAYYDFSAEAVAELLSRRLGGRLAEILRSAAKAI